MANPSPSTARLSVPADKACTVDVREREVDEAVEDERGHVDAGEHNRQDAQEAVDPEEPPERNSAAHDPGGVEQTPSHRRDE